MKSLLLLFATLLTLQVTAQFDDIEFKNKTYFDYIQTVQFSHNDLVLSLPIIDLKEDASMSGVLRLQFDDREGGYKNYTYQIIHCDKDWNPSNLTELEYLDGFNGEEIDLFSYSTNAYSEYTHYEVTLPNDDLMWTISGNYILSIYDQDLEQTVLTRQFIVAEEAVSISATIKKPENLSKLNTHQEIKANINFDNIRISRPMQELFLTVMQNGNTNSAYRNVMGTFATGNDLIFDRFDDLTFPALKEFRSCDVRSLKFRSEFVYSIDQKNGLTTVQLDTSKRRANKHFQTEPDANGGFIIENKDFGSGDVNSEYVDVNFCLIADREYYNEDVYITGAFTDWNVDDKYKLKFNPIDGTYSKVLSLKQGFYDYMFSTVNQDDMLEIETIEGSWFETENDYYFIVYYREIGGEYDRVLDVSVINSNIKR